MAKNKKANKKALVTGGSRGIGGGIVERLVAEGYEVVFTWNSDQEAARNCEDSLNGKAHAVQADLSSTSGIQDCLPTLSDLGPFHVIVNNATSATPIQNIVDTPNIDWEEALTIGVTAPFMLIRDLSPTMPAGGSIINISSLNTLMPQAGIAGYCAGKAALESLTMVASKELAQHGITVNAIRPGVTDTDGQRSVNSEDVLKQIATMTPLGRLGTPQDIASAVAFFAGEDSRWVTGQVLTVSGGL